MRIITTSGRARSRRARRLIAAVVLAAATSVVLGAGAPQVAADSPATAVLNSNKHALDALHNPPTDATTPGAGMSPPVQAVHMAMVLPGRGLRRRELDRDEGTGRTWMCRRHALGRPGCRDRHCRARRAGRGVNQAPLTATFTAAVRQSIIDRLDLLEAESLAAATAVDGAAAVADGIDAGEAAAAAMIAERIGDGPEAFRFTCGEEPGQWRPITSLVCTTPSGPSDPFAWVAKVEPFVVKSNEQFLSGGPTPLKSRAYGKEYNEVKTLGALGAMRTRPSRRSPTCSSPIPWRCTTDRSAHTRLGKASAWRSRRASSPSSAS